jgi:MFS family permease
MQEEKSLRYSWYVVGVLTLAYVSSFIDRQILALLVEPIKRDLQISDTQMSLLMGLSFGLFYTFLGIPIARLADTQSRKKIIAWGVGLWSLMTAVCGLAGNFFQLFLARMGVGVGEAALSPSAYSMIADYFPKNKLATANSVYNMGIFIGSGLAFLIGGWVVGLVKVQEMWIIPVIGEVYPWQVVFFCVGLPAGLIVVLLTVFTIKDPKRGTNKGKSEVSFAETIAYFSKNWKTYLTLNMGLGFVTLVNYANSAWVPTFLVRTYQMTPSQAGKIFGSIVMVFATLGLYFGGRLADYQTNKGHKDGRIRACVLLTIGFFLTIGVVPLMTSGSMAVWALIPVTFFSSSTFGAGTAAVQEVTPAPMRAMAAAIYLFVVNFIGLIFGPLSVALITDKIFHDPLMIRYSLLIVGLVGTALGILFLQISKKPFLKMISES